MIVADSSGIVASLLPRDSWHLRVIDFLSSTGELIGIPSPTLGEIAHFLGTRANAGVEQRFLRQLARGHFPVLEPVAADYLRAADLVEQYADFPLGTVDALVVAIAERLNVTRILTLDRRHFAAIRPTHCESFTLVP